jgi:hypothetical protein
VAFQINPKEKNYNHGKINFKDTGWSTGDEMDKL